ncbi:hypothetical protein [Legionella jordanis]|nr:hypothetical protein [Legionella jordanis]
MWLIIKYHQYPTFPNRVDSLEQLGQKINEYNQLFSGHKQKPTYIPTGLFIQSMEFDNANTVLVSGYVWQKYPNNLLPPEEGVVFPESKVRIWWASAYQLRFDDYQVRGWQFGGVPIFQDFDYSNYPFDIQVIWLRLWSREFYKNIILVPDLNAYQSTKQKLLGLEKNIVEVGLKFEESFFSMEKLNMDSNFGIKNYRYTENYPELYYNIIVSRYFIDAFIHYLLPVIVIWSILFSLVMMTRTKAEERQKLGLSTIGIISALGAAFFSILVINANLRSQFPGQPILYIELFYAVTYLVISLIAINAFIVTGQDKIPACLKWRDNLLPKLLFWPVILGSLALLTFFRFFM